VTIELALDRSTSIGLAAAEHKRHIKLSCGLTGWPRVGAEVACFLAVIAHHVTENFELGRKLSEMAKWYGVRDEYTKVLNFALYEERARQQRIGLLLLGTFITLDCKHENGVCPVDAGFYREVVAKNSI